MHDIRPRWRFFLLALALSGCAPSSSHVIIHETPSTSVWLAADPRAEKGHSHPFIMTPDSVATVLKGVLAEDRDTLTGMGIFGSENGRSAFTLAEIALLARYLAEALGKASPKDMATFYMVVSDANHNRAVTSGGLFIEDNRRLHLTLANCRSVPRGGQDYTIAMEVDTRDEPLLPVAAHRFRVGFQPAEAWIKHPQSEDRPSFRAYGSAYADPAKTVVIDLDRLLAHK